MLDSLLVQCLLGLQQTLLGGINMVDYLPWNGNYTNTVVRNNTIIGSFPYNPHQKTRRDLDAEEIMVKYAPPHLLPQPTHPYICLI